MLIALALIRAKIRQVESLLEQEREAYAAMKDKDSRAAWFRDGLIHGYVGWKESLEMLHARIEAKIEQETEA